MKLDELIPGQTVEVVYTRRDGKPAKAARGTLSGYPTIAGIGVEKHNSSDIVGILKRDILFMRVATFEEVDLK